MSSCYNQYHTRGSSEFAEQLAVICTNREEYGVDRLIVVDSERKEDYEATPAADLCHASLARQKKG